MKLKYIFILLFIINQSCNKPNTQIDANIKTGNLNYEIAISTDVEKIRMSTDDFSLHIDSILSGFINSQLLSTGEISFDLNNDLEDDIGFEIIDLLLFNGSDFPEHLDSLAVRVISHDIEIMDNSTFGYADALEEQSSINVDATWSGNRNSLVLGTFANSGNFNGKGWRYLGFRIKNGTGYNYGWINLYVSDTNDTIKINEFAYNEILNGRINAGQSE